MEKETIEKLKEVKQLLDEGILTQEEFDKEKQLLLATPPAVVEKNEMAIVEVEEVVSPIVTTTEQPHHSQIPSRTIHIPLLHRSVVMKASTPKAVIDKCNNYINRGKCGIGFGCVMACIFIYYCFTGGFWAILGAVFWALVPSLSMLITGPITISSYTELRDKFVGMNQAEFNHVQDVIRQKRANEREAVVTFVGEIVTTAADVYQQQTGNNMWYDVGSHIGNHLGRKY